MHPSAAARVHFAKQHSKPEGVQIKFLPLRLQLASEQALDPIISPSKERRTPWLSLANPVKTALNLISPESQNFFVTLPIPFDNPPKTPSCSPRKSKSREQSRIKHTPTRPKHTTLHSDPPTPTLSKHPSPKP